jgi:hypothetical protein
MSTTSRVYAEIWSNYQWNPIPTPKQRKGKQVPVCYLSLGTEYALYAALVGYYRSRMYHIFHTEEISPLSKPRGLPKDMNDIYTQYFEDQGMGGRWYVTWFMVQEVIDYDWNKNFPAFTGYVERQYAPLFTPSDGFPEAFPDDAHIYTTRKEDTVEVSWVESYRDFVGCADWFIGELLKLGNPKEVRVIFWLQ